MINRVIIVCLMFVVTSVWGSEDVCPASDTGNTLKVIIDGSHAYMQFKCRECKDFGGYSSVLSLMPGSSEENDDDDGEIIEALPWFVRYPIQLLRGDEPEEGPIEMKTNYPDVDAREHVYVYSDGSEDRFSYPEGEGFFLSNYLDGEGYTVCQTSSNSAGGRVRSVWFSKQGETMVPSPSNPTEDEDSKLGPALLFLMYLTGYGDLPMPGYVYQGGLPSGEDIKKSKVFQLTDYEAVLVYEYIREAYRKDKAGELKCSSLSYNCIGFVKDAYESAGLDKGYGSFFTHFIEKKWNRGNKNNTIVDQLYYGTIKKEIEYFDLLRMAQED